jgi:AraC-like DNA-binding protein
MTAGAKSLTERVKASARQAPRMWTMPSSDGRAFVSALERLGYGSEPLLAAAGLRSRDLDDPDARVPCDALGAMIARAQQERFTPNLALELARVTPIGAYPLLDYLVLTSETVGAGVQQLGRYNRIIGGPIEIDVREEGDAVRIVMASSAAPFSLEFVASLVILHFRNETDGRFAAIGVALEHTVDDPAAYERILACPIEQRASWNGIRVSLDMWRLPLRRRDSVLRQLLETQANGILAHQPARTGLAFRVQRALAPRVAGGDTSIGALARELAMSGRTLQRRLAMEGVSYHALLDDARKAAAGQYLRESTLAIGEIAYLVGYSEPAPFHRAFKRWFGKTPEAFRARKAVSR